MRVPASDRKTLRFYLCLVAGEQMEKFVPGQRVLQSGVYRVHHDSHRLMHEASLRAGEIFPCCKQCHTKIIFELVRRLRDEEVLPLGEGALLMKYSKSSKSQSA